MAKKSVSEQRQETVGKLLDELWTELEEVRGNLEEKFSGTERYQRVESAIDSLEMAKDEVENAKYLLPTELQYSLDLYEKANIGFIKEKK